MIITLQIILNFKDVLICLNLTIEKLEVCTPGLGNSDLKPGYE